MKKKPTEAPFGEMTYIEFLQTTKVLKMLYGSQIAQRFFEENIISWYNVTNASFLKNREAK